MKKLQSFLVVFFLATIFASSAQAQINWLQVQLRTYEDGREFTRVQFALNSDTYVVTNLILHGPDGLQVPGVELSDFTQTPDIAFYPAYTFERGMPAYWNWPPPGPLPWNTEYVSWANYNFDPEIGLYALELEIAGIGTVWRFFSFNGEVDLPIVTLRKKPGQKTADNKLDVEFTVDGSMTLWWEPRPVTHTDTSLRVYLILNSGPLEWKTVYIKQPTHMGMLLIPPHIITALQNEPEYEGCFDFLIQLRTNDNNNRSYSNVQTYCFDE